MLVCLHLQTFADCIWLQQALSFLTYMVLINILIPISLYVSMELVKFGQAWLISRDLDMYHKPVSSNRETP